MVLYGYVYVGDDLEGFMGVLEVIWRFCDYVDECLLLISEGCVVYWVGFEFGGYVIDSSWGLIYVQVVVVVIGEYCWVWLFWVLFVFVLGFIVLYFSDYRGFGQLFEGVVLVIGGGQFGVQIVQDLCDGGCSVYWLLVDCYLYICWLCGKDLMIWWDMVGCIY